MKQAIAFLMVLFLSPILYAESYTIETYIEKVRTNSNDLKLAQMDRQKADAMKSEAWASALPKLFGQAEYKRNLRDYYTQMDIGFGPMEIDGNKDNEYSFNLVLTQPIFSMTARSALRAAGQFEKLSDFVYQASEDAIVIAAKKLFYQGLLLKNVWNVSQNSEQQAKDTYLSTKNKFSGGVVSEFGMLQAEIGWKNEIPKVMENRRNYQLLLANLKILAGIPADQPLELQGNFDVYPEFPEKIGIDEVLATRADFQAILMEKELKETDIKAQSAGHWPTVDASLIYNYSAASDEMMPEDDNKLLIAGLTVKIPLYSGGYTSAQVQKARIEHSKALVKIEKTRREIETELSNIYLRLSEAQQRIQSAQATRKTAEKAYSIGKVQLDNGLTTQLQLKDARIFLEQAQLAYFSAVFDYLSAYLDWEKAVGRAA